MSLVNPRAPRWRRFSTSVLIIVCGGLAISCSTIQPTTEVSPTVGLSVTVSVDCGPFAADLSDCLAIVSAAATVVPVVPGSQVQVTKRVAAAVCQPEPSCVTTAAAALIAHVAFTAPGGSLSSADVVTNPLGQYVGANPSIGQ
jgi:hypothetical protein